MTAAPDDTSPAGAEATPRLAVQRVRAYETIEAILARRLVRAWPFGRAPSASLLLDAEDVGCWTVHTEQGRVWFERGRPARPTACVYAKGDTWADVLSGARSGLEAWLDGDLRVRGSIALAMKLEGLVERPGTPAHFPVPKTQRVGGIDTFYLEAGRGERTVVLLHGLGATNSSLLPTLRALAPSYRVIAPDLPGFGDSAKPLRPYHAGFFAKWALRLLDTVGADRAYWVGNSLGGRIAIEIALRAPERVERLALFSPAVAMRRFRQFVPIVRIARPELAVLPMRISREAVESVIRMMFSNSERLGQAWYDAACDEFIRVFRTRRGRIAFFSAAREIYLDSPWGERGFWQRLERLAPRALFLWGDRDVLVPPSFSRHVQQAVPRARSLVMRDSGHVPQFEHPTRTHRLVLDFFEEP